MPDFELTVIIDQEVTRREVTGNDVRGVNVLETAKGMMNKRPEMSVGEWLLGADLCREQSVTQLADTERRIVYNGVQIGLHRLRLLEGQSVIVSDGDPGGGKKRKRTYK